MEQSDNGKYNSVEVAKYIVAYWNERGSYINMTKTQKLLYIAYGTWLAFKNKRLVDEYPRAWPFGPVFPKTREALLNMDFNNISFKNVVDEELKNDIEVESVIKEIHQSQFGHLTAKHLTAWSHQDGSAWATTTALPNFIWGQYISDEITKKWFLTFLNI